MNPSIIVVGRENVPDRTSRTGWKERAYARKVSSVDMIEDRESVWSGELRWTDGDPEGRFDAGWMGPHGLIFSDRAAEMEIAALRSQIAAFIAAIKLAETGHKSQEWDDVTQEWVMVSTPATDGELAAGLEAMDGIEAARAELDAAQVRQIDGSEHAAALDALREQRAAEKAAAAKAGNMDALPSKIKDLIACLKGDGMVGVSVDRSLYWQVQYRPTYRAYYQSDLSDYWELLAPLAEESQKEPVRNWFHE
jgi:hypothetical protein